MVLVSGNNWRAVDGCSTLNKIRTILGARRQALHSWLWKNTSPERLRSYLPHHDDVLGF